MTSQAADVTPDPRLRLDALEIKPLSGVDATVRVLGSKSYTNRHIAMAALSPHSTTLHNALLADDTRLLAAAVASFGHVDVAIDEAASTISLVPTGLPMRAPADAVYMGNAGTGLRALITLASLADGRTLITGNARMQERPMGDLLSALRPLGVSARAVRDNGSPPIEVEGVSLAGGSTEISGAVSSQFTTSLLMSAPCAQTDVEISVVDDMVSKPYIDMTIAAMARTGVDVRREGFTSFGVRAGQVYEGGDIDVEPDASGMSYFLAAAAILGGRVHVPGIGTHSVQGDVGLVAALESMGCRAVVTDAGVTLEGGSLNGIEIDMENMPDVAPTLAMVAAYAAGTTHITGIGNLRVKECDRIQAMSDELAKMGACVRSTRDTMTIDGGTTLRGADIDTYDDHRIAMCFAIAGLRTPGVVVKNPGCVMKSFPGFWRRLDGLRANGAAR
ncbi:MAG TPA: 3-phosphoshikimate 1-carboxyvinyltransferase [Streptosporangiaceae bacterium]|nr:3-phosphoshikimate 1-carboxyvinyltransferase [Streptosporangiaceae bacterium]